MRVFHSERSATFSEVADPILAWMLQIIKHPSSIFVPQPMDLKPIPKAKGASIPVGLEVPILGHHLNAKSFGFHMGLVGVMEYVLSREKVSFFEVNPQQTKVALVGRNAEKHAMVEKAEHLYGPLQGTRAEREAIADAIGVAEAAYLLEFGPDQGMEA